MRINFKNILAISLSCALSLLFVINAIGAETKSVPSPDDYDSIAYGFTRFVTPTAKSVAELEQWADIVIRGKVVENVEQIYRSPLTGYTLTSVEITDVYSGEKKVGDLIEIAEDYLIFNNGVKKVMSSGEGYLPCQIGEEYIFFLKLNDGYSLFKETTYIMHNCIMGRFPVNVSETTPASKTKAATITVEAVESSEVPVAECGNIETYMSLYEQVINKYAD